MIVKSCKADVSFIGFYHRLETALLRFGNSLTLIMLPPLWILCAASPLKVGTVPADQNAPVRGSMLTIRGGDSIRPSEIPEATFDFGQFSLLSAAPIAHTFVLRINGQKPLTLERLHSSCGCTRAFVEGSARRGMPLVMIPGRDVRIRVSVDPTKRRHGPARETVSLWVRGRTTPAVILQMIGTFLPPVSFSPTVLDFGIVRAHSARSLTVTVAMDARLQVLSRPPRLVCSDPDVRITVQNRAAPQVPAPIPMMIRSRLPFR